METFDQTFAHTWDADPFALQDYSSPFPIPNEHEHLSMDDGLAWAPSTDQPLAELRNWDEPYTPANLAVPPTVAVTAPSCIQKSHWVAPGIPDHTNTEQFALHGDEDSHGSIESSPPTYGLGVAPEASLISSVDYSMPAQPFESEMAPSVITTPICPDGVSSHAGNYIEDRLELCSGGSRGEAEVDILAKAAKGNKKDRRRSLTEPTSPGTHKHPPASAGHPYRTPPSNLPPFPDDISFHQVEDIYQLIPNRRQQIITDGERLLRKRTAVAKSRTLSNLSIKQLQEEEFKASSRNQALSEEYNQLKGEALCMWKELLEHNNCECHLIQQYVTATWSTRRSAKAYSPQSALLSPPLSRQPGLPSNASG